MLACDGEGLPPRFPANSRMAPGWASASTRGVDQRVMHHDIGLGETGKRMQREQARIPWACAGKPYMARLKPRKSGHGAAQAVVHAGYPSR